MFVYVTTLRYWKSEHNESTCEDAVGHDGSRGMFVVADGVGTALFSSVWARELVNYSLAVPLMSDDPFEVEWWVRQVQKRYEPLVLKPEQLAWNAQQKAQNQGSYSTLATLRVLRREPTVQAELLAFGDSCILVGTPATQEITSFPLQKPADFDQAPICVPSMLRVFNRHFHRCSVKQVELQADQIVILATDAVSKWILSGGNGRYDVWQAFQEVAHQIVDSWPEFILECRDRKEIVDDDSTALVVRLQSNADGAVELGVTPPHDSELIAGRKEAFEKARAEQNKELAAIYFGDGVDLHALKVEGSVSPEYIDDARKVADAMKEVLLVLRNALNTPDLPAKVGPVWQRNAHLLLYEPCAANLRQSLQASGVQLVPPAPPAPPAVPWQNMSSGSPTQLATPAIAVQHAVDTSLPQGDVSSSQSNASSLASLRSARDEEKENMLRALRKTIEVDDDELILRAWQPLLETYLPARRYLRRIEEARRRTEALRTFRRALDSENYERIVKDYDPILNHHKKIKNEEWKQLQDAVIRYFAGCDFGTEYSSNLRQLDLIRKFVEAYRANDDEAIVATYQELTEAQYTDFKPQERTRIEAARTLLKQLEDFRVALQDGNPFDIVDMARPLTDNCYERLSLEESRLLELAKRFVEAYHNEDDEALLATYSDIQDQYYHTALYTVITRQEAKRLRQARERQGALRRLREMLKTGTAQQKVDAFEPVLHGYTGLIDSEREQLRLAAGLVDAYNNANSDAAIREAYQAILDSPYKDCFAYSDDERHRIERAKRASEACVVVVLNGRPISFQEFKKVYDVREYYLRTQKMYNEQQLQKMSLRPPKEQEQLRASIETIQERLDPQRLSQEMLSELIDDTFIQAAIKYETEHGANPNNFNVSGDIEDRLNKLRIHNGTEFRAFLTQHHLEEKDVEDVLLISLRRRKFEQYLQKPKQTLPFGAMGQRSVKLSTWLEQRKQSVKITYPEKEFGDEQTTNTHQARSWVLQQSDWRKPKT
jgi:serine/threonine protein phosphatase PrpC